MKQHEEIRSATRMGPLLRSIAREISERRKAVAALEFEIESFGSTKAAHAEEIAVLESDLANHRRELRRVEKELSHLGWTVDEGHPMRMIRKGRQGGADMTWQPEQTGFYLSWAENSST